MAAWFLRPEAPQSAHGAVLTPGARGWCWYPPSAPNQPQSPARGWAASDG